MTLYLPERTVWIRARANRHENRLWRQYTIGVDSLDRRLLLWEVSPFDQPLLIPLSSSGKDSVWLEVLARVPRADGRIAGERLTAIAAALLQCGIPIDHVVIWPHGLWVAQDSTIAGLDLDKYVLPALESALECHLVPTTPPNLPTPIDEQTGYHLEEINVSERIFLAAQVAMRQWQAYVYALTAPAGVVRQRLTFVAASLPGMVFDITLDSTTQGQPCRAVIRTRSDVPLKPGAGLHQIYQAIVTPRDTHWTEERFRYDTVTGMLNGGIQPTERDGGMVRRHHAQSLLGLLAIAEPTRETLSLKVATVKALNGPR